MPEAAEAVSVEASRFCYRCKALMHAATPDVCPECGRAQSRVCFCGATISRGAAECPECGTDWSRIRRSRRQSKEERRAERSRAALIGGAVALLASGIAYGLWRLAVSGHAATGAEAVGSAVGSLGASMVRALEIAWVPLLVFVLGAVGGLVTHYVRQRRRRRKRRRVSKRRDPSTV